MVDSDDGSPVVTHWDGGIEWIAHPDEFMERASHAIVGETGVWLVDPLDFDGLTALLGSLGDVAGIVPTLDRHTRDAELLARRFDVPIQLPPGLLALSSSLDAETELLDAFLADTGFEPVNVVDIPAWREYALYDSEQGTVIFGDSIGTADYFRAPGDRLSIHPFLRLWPPRAAFERVVAKRVLVGHGPGVMTDGESALQEAIRSSRRRAPKAYARGLGISVGHMVGL